MISIDPDFKYVHEPHGYQDTPIPSLAHDQQVRDLQTRVLHSNGGAFLLTGFRGVGKTSLVYELLDSLAGSKDGRFLVPVVINVARPMSTAILLFEVIRRLYESLLDSGLLGNLPSKIARTIVLAYARTSLSLGVKKTKGSEYTKETSAKSSKLITELSGFEGAFKFGAKKTLSMATEASMLAYSETDVEHDFQRIASLLCDEREWPSSLWQRLMRRLRPSTSRPSWRGRLIVVLDELDKLTATEEGILSFENILRDLKSILSTRGVYFILVGGTDLYERWHEDARKGNSLYESVFATQIYIPCEWNMAGKLLTSLAIGSSGGALVSELRDFLDFKARGIPRRLLTEFNGLIKWSNGLPAIVASGSCRKSVSFYSSMQQALVRFFASRTSSEILREDYNEDRWRVSIYYLLDWILRTNGREFTFAELISREQNASIVDASLEIDSDEVDKFVEYLIESDIVEDITKPFDLRTLIPWIPEADSRRFRLSEPVQERLSGLAEGDQLRREPPPAPSDQEPREPPTIPPPPSLPKASLVASIEGRKGRAPVDHISSSKMTTEEVATPEYVGREESEAQFLARSERSQRLLSEFGSILGKELTPPPKGPRKEGEPRSIKKQGMAGDRYDVEYLIGRGGMGRVYQARDRILGRNVALKLISPHYKNDTVANQRFLREARIAASLSHSNIVRTFDLVRSDGAVIMIMELLTGPSLRRMAVDHPLAPVDVVRVSMTLAAALQYIHQRHICRIDLKPDNIIMERDRGPVIVDLGLARPSQGSDQSQLTATQDLVGTPLYMAPEQFLGKPPDIRVDLYSLGILMYELLSGARPWAEEPDGLKSLLKLKEKGSPSIDDLQVSEELRVAVSKTLEPAPSERYQSPRDLYEALAICPEAKHARD